VKRQPFLSTALGILALMLCCGSAVAAAQQMEHSAPSPSTHLTIKTYEGKTLTLSPEELAALPHKSVSVFNAHSKANETYSGVPLADLLSKVGVPLGESVRGKVFLTGVVASGVDGYGVLYSLAEVDPSIHTGDVIVADTVDGKKLDKDGAFKMVSSEERRPARWVRNLASISVVKVEP
jgi:Oxidoreductase molybdopterin binding domain